MPFWEVVSPDSGRRRSLISNFLYFITAAKKFGSFIRAVMSWKDGGRRPS